LFDNEIQIPDINLIFSCNVHRIRSVRCLSETNRLFKLHSKDIKGKDYLQHRGENIIKVIHERAWACKFAQVWGPVASLLRTNNKS
jgi:hypothetical protein